MVTTAEQVERYLEEDLALREILARGVLNLRRAARWLIKQEGWETTEEAVVSALRRYGGSSGAGQLEKAKQALGRADVGLRSGLALVSIPGGPGALMDLARFAGELGPDDTFAVLFGDQAFHVLTDARGLKGNLEAVGLGDRPAMEVAAVSLSFLDDSKVFPLAVAMVLNVFAQQGIQAREMFTCGSAYALVVDAPQARRAFRAACALTDTS